MISKGFGNGVIGIVLGMKQLTFGSGESRPVIGRALRMTYTTLQSGRSSGFVQVVVTCEVHFYIQQRRPTMASGPADGVSRYSDVASIKDFALPSTSKFQIIVILTNYMQNQKTNTTV